jgi:hypothetical protein
MMDNLIEISLPYLVYMTKIVKDISPIIRKTHAKDQIVRDGISVILHTYFFFVICIFSYDLFFFNFINE